MRKLIPLPLKEMTEFIAVDDTSPTGLRWKKNAGHKRAGTVAGSIPDRGLYSQVQFFGRAYQASRVVYALSHGMDIGDMQVDHVDRDRSNNSIKNLRLVSHRENCQNKTNHGKHPPGVNWHKAANAFVASIYLNGSRKHLGCFASSDEAAAAYQKACNALGQGGGQ
jgi:hypothetical protein